MSTSTATRPTQATYHDAYRSTYRSARKVREWEPMVRRIIGVDGEGDNIPDTGDPYEPQAYTLLAFSDDRGYHDHVADNATQAERLGRPVNPETGFRNYGLSTEACLEFLLGIKQHPSDLVVGFSITYDGTQILRDLPTAMKEDLARRGWVVWRKYRIEFTPKQSLRVSDITSEHVLPDGRLKYARDVRVWDTFAYFQQSFVSVLEKAEKGLLNEDQVAFIADMKTKRGGFATQAPETVLRYCLAECEYLSILVRDLLVQLDRIGYAPNAYYGPGPVVMQFMDKLRLTDYMPSVDPHGYYEGDMPSVVAERAYYGGRFELRQIGFAGDGWNLDIRSAYPAAMVKLPCLRHGTWEETAEFLPGVPGFYKVGSKTSGPWAPFPFRVGKQPKKGERRTVNHAPLVLRGGDAVGDDGGSIVSEGSILYAHGGIRWVGHEEVAVALKHFPADQIPIYAGWVWRSTCEPYMHRASEIRGPGQDLPFAPLADLYDLRAEAKKPPYQGVEKAYKLLINSAYGKTAQGIGWVLAGGRDEVISDRANYRPPKYQCYVWAAWITSSTRALVTDVALTYPDAVVSIATDGIIATQPITTLPLSKRLGDWEETKVSDIWLGMPGIYTYNEVDLDTGERKKTDFKRRGFSAKHFPPDHLKDAWRAGSWRVKNVPEEDFVPSADEPDKTMRAFVPMKQAVKRTNIEAIYGMWVPTSKELNLYPLKRVPFESPDGHDGTVVDTMPLILPDNVISKPYQPKQTWEDVAATANEDADLYYLAEEDEVGARTR